MVNVVFHSKERNVTHSYLADKVIYERGNVYRILSEEFGNVNVKKEDDEDVTFETVIEEGE